MKLLVIVITLSVIAGSIAGIIAGAYLIWKKDEITAGGVLFIVPVLILAIYGIVVAVIFKETKEITEETNVGNKHSIVRKTR